ncbi:methylated-DNA--[protein]-cysteine S-methyltransferase [Lewinella sp. 4G2]|uniref:methylated-DNA--[protein]-cysteine S-methyltransferase n=1 Tax=Lewinella sp. 4G2 TaxID=1803372 RepID=UPI0007B4602E|nr:methylated-DNA--[protein]-cysteine S-methyltransferase [Lewinella sp. 4G2]OAV43009.1 cysteine methyltransferase [Lewinella sp. 4G2]
MTHFHATPYGTFKLVASDTGLREVKLDNDLSPHLEAPTHPILLKTTRQLDAYFSGTLREFNLPFDWSGATDFHRAVWRQLLEIKYGRTVSYQFIADRLGDPKACQAVGQANRRNPIAIIVPCHRVIAKTGDLHGYFYGLDFKRSLLGLENPKSFGVQGSLF